MALRQEPTQLQNRRRSRRSKKESSFRTHLAAYLGVGAFLFTLNLLTSPFDLWFYWPLFFWGWCLVLHAVITYGIAAPSRVLDDAKSLVPGLSGALSASPTSAERAADVAPFAASAFAAVHGRLERLKSVARQIGDGSLREQAERFCAESERIVATMARDRADAGTVHRFDAELLAPVESLLEEYSYAVSHDSPDAFDVARRIAERDLPLLQARLDAMTYAAQLPGAVDPAAASDAFGAEPSPPQGLPIQSRP